VLPQGPCKASSGDGRLDLKTVICYSGFRFSDIPQPLSLTWSQVHPTVICFPVDHALDSFLSFPFRFNVRSRYDRSKYVFGRNVDKGTWLLSFRIIFATVQERLGHSHGLEQRPEERKKKVSISAGKLKCPSTDLSPCSTSRSRLVAPQVGFSPYRRDSVPSSLSHPSSLAYAVHPYIWCRARACRGYARLPRHQVEDGNTSPVGARPPSATAPRPKISG
jgi:hypothetical protein